MTKLVNSDCLSALKNIEDNSVDSLVTDPPAGISFMNKSWDDDKGGRKQWIAWMTEVMQECLRVMKPGAHGLVWALPRTSHWTATALEDAGFEIRDVVTHLFGTGFPKSLNLGEGWGTALKPANEHWILIRKPCSEKTVAANVIKWGVGGLNIDVSRVGFLNETDKSKTIVPTGKIVGSNNNRTRSGVRDDIFNPNNQGRFPANLVLSCSDKCTEETHDLFECPVYLLDEQSGVLTSGKPGTRKKEWSGYQTGLKKLEKESGFGDTGGASRFFYCAKASKSDKGESNTHPTVKSSKLMTYLIKLITPSNGIVLDPFMGSGSTCVSAKKENFKFIGIEKELEYFEIAKSRVSR